MGNPTIIYFSSATENTKIFVEKLAIPSSRIPLYRYEKELPVEEPYVLFIPTYGGGQGEAAVPPQVKRFLKSPDTRALCVGVIGGGNMNFGEKYAAAADVVAAKLGVPVLYRFELRGTEEDLVQVTEGINSNWNTLLAMRGL
jgi:protein involved in ribonucleotide reduction